MKEIDERSTWAAKQLQVGVLSRNNRRPKMKRNRSMFSSMILNKGSEYSEHVVHNEVFFPRLKESAKDASSDKIKASYLEDNELRSMWMIGFLHHEKSIKDNLADKDLNTFSQLPGSAVLPTAQNAARSNQKRSWPLKKQNSKNTQLKHDPKCQLTQEERRRLDEIGNRLIKKRNKSKKWALSEQKLAPYVVANRKLKKVLRNKIPYQSRDEIRSKPLEIYFQINRSEIEASVTLQCFWRKWLATTRMRMAKLRKKCAILIQAVARGMITRRRVTIWKRKRAYYIVKCQAHLRRRIDSQKWQTKQEEERIKATLIQSIVRKFIASCKFIDLNKNRAATVIQTRWLAQKRRKKYLGMERDKSSTKIQNIIRRHLSKRRFDTIKTDKTTAALKIAKLWRGYLARSGQSQLLHQRDVEKRKCYIQSMLKEYNYLDDSLRTYRKSMVRKKCVEDWGELKREEEGKLDNLEMTLHREEKAYLELKRLSSRASPKSVEHGWQEQTDAAVQNARRNITNLKLKIVFEERDHMRQVFNRFEEHRNLEEAIEADRNIVEIWKNESLKELWDVQRKFDSSKKDVSVRQAIADEKRKWAMKHTVPSGKPDKRTSEVTSFQFCLGTAVPMYDCHNKTALTSRDRLQKLEDMIKLHSYQNQVRQYESVLKPLQSILSRRLENISDHAPSPLSLQISKNGSRNPSDEADVGKSSIISDINTRQISRAVESPCEARTSKKKQKKTAISRLPWYLLDKLKSEQEIFIQEKTLSKIKSGF